MSPSPRRLLPGTSTYLDPQCPSREESWSGDVGVADRLGPGQPVGTACMAGGAEHGRPHGARVAGVDHRDPPVARRREQPSLGADLLGRPSAGWSCRSPTATGPPARRSRRRWFSIRPFQSRPGSGDPALAMTSTPSRSALRPPSRRRRRPPLSCATLSGPSPEERNTRSTPSSARGDRRARRRVAHRQLDVADEPLRGSVRSRTKARTGTPRAARSRTTSRPHVPGRSGHQHSHRAPTLLGSTFAFIRKTFSGS